MQKTAVITIELLSYWHAGSGSGRGGDVDALVLKDAAGLPYLPGRTLKGLLREGLHSCEEAGVVEEGRTNLLFGTRAAAGDYAGSIPGELMFDNAVLPAEEQAWLASEKGAPVRQALYDRFAATAINEKNGLAKDKTLRAVELCVPVTLLARVSGPRGAINWIDDLEKACALTRALGSHRNRGLGRCHMTLKEQG